MKDYSVDQGPVPKYPTIMVAKAPGTREQPGNLSICLIVIQFRRSAM